jgi:hypothetical protein
MSNTLPKPLGCSDALMFDYRGYVAEATTAPTCSSSKDGEVHNLNA